MEDEKDNKPQIKESNPFLEKLKSNQVAQAQEALLKTMTQNAGQTVGGIIDALEQDDDGDYIMLEIFKRLTLEEIASAVLDSGQLNPVSEKFDDDGDDEESDTSGSTLEEEEEGEEEDELEDDDEFDDDGDDDEDDEEPPPPPKVKKTKKKKKGKKGKKSGKSGEKAAKKKKAPKKKASKKVGSWKEPSSASVKDAPNKKEILACLRSHKARDEETAMSSKQIRDEVGGDADAVRPLLHELYDGDKIDKCGEARGTKYFLA